MNPPLITADEHEQLLANGAARAAGQGIDPLPAVRLFTPDAHATWLLAALDPADGDTAWGLIDLGIGLPALGTVKLSDLASIVGPRQQPVMRDRYFLPERPLSEYIQPSKWTLTPNKLDEAISQTGRRRWYQKRSAGSDVAALPPI
ncbi:DUF2958 domain-containing protein, partial [Xanthomonas citri]|uniref:DUF2958 domain-containing protein n=1 Tax=Xanthomonas citri TaxID=346 RepID=UPI00402AFA29